MPTGGVGAVRELKAWHRSAPTWSLLVAQPLVETSGINCRSICRTPLVTVHVLYSKQQLRQQAIGSR